MTHKMVILCGRKCDYFCNTPAEEEEEVKERARVIGQFIRNEQRNIFWIGVVVHFISHDAAHYIHALVIRI